VNKFLSVRRNLNANSVGTGDKKEEKVFMETKAIVPKLLWCSSQDSAVRHQFHATKVYVLKDNPDKGFAICPQHGEIIEVSLEQEAPNKEIKPLEEAVKKLDKESDEDFFMKQLCNRMKYVFRSYTSSVEFYLQYKSKISPLEQPKPLSRLFVLYFNSGSRKQDVEKIFASLEKFKTNFGLPYDMIDTKNMSEEELTTIYTLCAHRASSSRLYGKEGGFSVRDKLSPYRIGIGEPVLLVYSKYGIDFVLPHRAGDRQALAWRSATMEICPFLVVLETAAQNELKDSLTQLGRARADLAALDKKS
jgi:hypothetical protein